MFRLAVFTDEISQDFELACDVAKEYELEGVEVRSVWNNAPQDIPPEDIARMKEILRERDLKVCSIASPFFKCDIDSEEEYEEHLDILRRCIALGKEFDCTIIRGFTFWRKGRFVDYKQRILDKFEEPVRILESEGVTLGIENESSTFVGTAKELSPFLEELNSASVRATWDPCNSLTDEDVEEVPYPNGYELIKPYIVHIHIKDWGTDRQTGKKGCVPIGEGEVDFDGQFRALIRDGYEGYASLETHWRPVALSEEELNRPGGDKFSESGEYASRVCLENLRKILARIT